MNAGGTRKNSAKRGEQAQTRGKGKAAGKGRFLQPKQAL